MKKVLLLIMAGLLISLPAIAKTDKYSAEYLKNHKHFAILNPPVEGIAQFVIRKSLKKETGANFKVKFDGYTLSGMKKGIFKYLEITGKNVVVEGIEVPFVSIKTLSDYNYVDYTQDPVVFKSDMDFVYSIKLSEKSVNDALKNKEYQKTIQKVNKLAYPLFTINDVCVRIRNNKVYIIMQYNFPISPAKQNKTFMISSSFKVENGKIKAHNIGLDKAYGNISIDKITNLVNLLDPLSFTLDLMDSQKCDGKLDTLVIKDNLIQVNGRLHCKGEK